MFDFDKLDFVTVTHGGRGSSNDPVSITHSFKTKKNELLFRLSRDVMDKAGLKYGDKVHIQFASDNTFCRIVASKESGSVTLSQQVKNFEQSAGLVRLTYRTSLPNFLEVEGLKLNKALKRVKYVHESDMLQCVEGSVTFKLKLAETE